MTIKQLIAAAKARGLEWEVDRFDRIRSVGRGAQHCPVSAAVGGKSCFDFGKSARKSGFPDRVCSLVAWAADSSRAPERTLIVRRALIAELVEGES